MEEQEKNLHINSPLVDHSPDLEVQLVKSNVTIAFFRVNPESEPLLVLVVQKWKNFKA